VCVCVWRVLSREAFKEGDVGRSWRDAIAAARLRVSNQRLECRARLGGELSGRDAGLCENLADCLVLRGHVVIVA